jgi:hypothetical protein
MPETEYRFQEQLEVISPSIVLREVRQRKLT